MIRRIVTIIVLGVLSIVPALAALDGGQSTVAALLREGQAELHEIEHLPVAERGPGLHDHMALIGHAAAAAKILQPKTGLSSKERLVWRAEQQKLFENMVQQMLDNHHLMMEMLQK